MFLLVMDARYEVHIHSESPDYSTKHAHNTCTINLLFVEFLCDLE